MNAVVDRPRVTEVEETFISPHPLADALQAYPIEKMCVGLYTTRDGRVCSATALALIINPNISIEDLQGCDCLGRIDLVTSTLENAGFSSKQRSDIYNRNDKESCSDVYLSSPGRDAVVALLKKWGR